MEAHGTTTAPATSPKAGAGLRIGAVVLALVLAFITAVAVIVMIDIGELTPCADVTSIDQLNSEGECFDGGSTSKTISLVLGWPGAIMAGIATLLALAFAVRGRGGRQLGIAILVGAVLLGLSLIIG